MKRKTFPKKYFDLKKIANEVIIAMLEKIPGDLSDEDYGYIIAQVNLNLAHTILKLLPLETEEE